MREELGKPLVVTKILKGVELAAPLAGTEVQIAEYQPEELHASVAGVTPAHLNIPNIMVLDMREASFSPALACSEPPVGHVLKGLSEECPLGTLGTLR